MLAVHKLVLTTQEVVAIMPVDSSAFKKKLAMKSSSAEPSCTCVLKKMPLQPFNPSSGIVKSKPAGFSAFCDMQNLNNHLVINPRASRCRLGKRINGWLCAFFTRRRAVARHWFRFNLQSFGQNVPVVHVKGSLSHSGELELEDA